MKPNVVHFNEQSYDWLSWRNGTLYSLFNIVNNEHSIIANRNIIRKYAIGYCDSSNIPCRPKIGYVAVMFQYESEQFWTHLTKKEFSICFPEVII